MSQRKHMEGEKDRVPPQGCTTAPRELRVGVLSDTHGRMHPGCLPALTGSRDIVHAGDIGSPDVLSALATVAPVTAVRGNVDRAGWAAGLPQAALLEVGGVRIYVIHDVNDLDLDPGAAGVSVVVSGHTHEPRIETRRGVLYLNPGSAGPKRFRLPITLATLVIRNGKPEAKLIPLDS